MIYLITIRPLQNIINYYEVQIDKNFLYCNIVFFLCYTDKNCIKTPQPQKSVDGKLFCLDTLQNSSSFSGMLIPTKCHF